MIQNESKRPWTPPAGGHERPGDVFSWLPARSVLAHFVPAHFGPPREDRNGHSEFSVAHVLFSLLIDVHFGLFYDTHFGPINLMTRL